LGKFQDLEQPKGLSPSLPLRKLWINFYYNIDETLTIEELKCKNGYRSNFLWRQVDIIIEEI
jgi:hypothetical protein